MVTLKIFQALRTINLTDQIFQWRAKKDLGNKFWIIYNRKKLFKILNTVMSELSKPSIDFHTNEMLIVMQSTPLSLHSVVNDTQRNSHDKNYNAIH